MSKRIRVYMGTPKRGESLPAMVKRIEAVYLDATAAHVDAGMSWYQVAQDEAVEISAVTGLPVDVAAAVIAATSPQCKWDQNLKRAWRACSAWARGSVTPDAIGGLGKYIAARVLADLDPSHVKGQKTSSFLANILGDTDRVTIDLWAIRVAVGHNRYDPIPVTVYRRAAAAYTKVARKYGVTPRDMQAIVWCAARGTGE